MSDPAPISRTRRFALPVVVAIIALGLIIWSRYQAVQRTDEALQFVQRLCAEAAAGRELRGMLNPDDAFSEQQTIEQLLRVCDSPASASKIEIVPVDPNSLNINPEATHAAMLRMNDDDRLGLLIVHDGKMQPRITGYWLPSP